MTNIQKYLDEMRKIQDNLLTFLDSYTDIEERFHNINAILNDLDIKNNKYKLKSLLHLIEKISNNHYHSIDFFDKISRVLLLFKNEIKNYFSNLTIFNIFQNSKRILLFLLEENIMKFEQDIIEKIMNDFYFLKNFYPIYFLPEIRQFRGEKWLNEHSDFENIDNKYQELPDDFYNKRNEGQNDSYICKLIQKDLIEEFIIYVNKNIYPLNSFIDSSIFETNKLLLDENDIALIEYAAFYNSVQIFNYLRLNGVELKPSLYIYAIHGESEEIIHLLEENHIDPPTKKNDENKYLTCFKESIKCHQNDFANYFLSNYLNDDYSKDTNILILEYYNFAFIHNNFINEDSFIYLCTFDYYIFVNILLKEIDIDLNKLISFTIFIQFYEISYFIFQ